MANTLKMFILLVECGLVQRDDCINCETCYLCFDPAFVWPSLRLSRGLGDVYKRQAQDLAIQKLDQNRNNMSHSLYNHPYALNHIQLVKCTFDNYEVILKVLAIIYHRFHVAT